MLAIPNPQPTRPPLPFLDDLSSFLLGTAFVVSGAVLLLLVLWATGVLRQFGMSAQTAILVIGVLTVVAIIVGVLGVVFRG